MIEFTEVQEQSRTYHYAGDVTFTVDKVIRFAAPGSTHRLETSDGRKLIINGDWLAIDIDTENWSA